MAKTNIKISLSGASYYDSDKDDTVHFNCLYDPSGKSFPDTGTTIWLKMWDSGGWLETIEGNTHLYHNGYNLVPRTAVLSKRELIKDLLNID